MYENFFHWNPDPFIFILPGLDRPVGWYGLCFALGFFIAQKVFSVIFYKQLQHRGLFLEVYFKDMGNTVLKLQNALNKQLESEYTSSLSKGLLSKIKKFKEGDKVTEKFRRDVFEHLNKVFESKFSDNKTRGFEVLQNTLGINFVKTYGDFVTEKALTYTIICVVIGARLFHVFFYGWDYYSKNLSEIPMVWKGGLASHGGVVGVLVAVYLATKLVKKVVKDYTFYDIMAPTSICIGVAFFFIRLGNFFNQEILGKPSNMPWAVVFQKPAAGHSVVPRHPVQLYEAFSYLFVFFVLNFLWKKFGDKVGRGFYFGVGLIGFWSLRFICEFFKMTQSDLVTNNDLLTMGQWLTFPFIFWGIWILVNIKKNGKSYE